MRNRFNINEEEKNRIRALHGIKIITEQNDDLLLIKKEDLPEEYHNCVTFEERDHTVTGIGNYAYCKYGEYNLPISVRTAGDYLTIEDCCELGGDINEQDEKPDEDPSCMHQRMKIQ